MGNKSEKPKNTKRTKSKLDRNELEEDEEFFDDNIPKEIKKKIRRALGQTIIS